MDSRLFVNPLFLKRTVSLYKRGCPMGGILETGSSAAYADRFIRAMINPPYKPAQCEGKSIYTIREFLEMKDNYEGGR